MTVQQPRLDDRGSRRLGTAEERAWYAIAAVSYMVAGLLYKPLFNWFVGPLWLVLTVWWGPMLVDRMRRRS